MSYEEWGMREGFHTLRITHYSLTHQHVNTLYNNDRSQGKINERQDLTEKDETGC